MTTQKPATCDIASASLTYFAGLPMTTPSSTSQSLFCDPRGSSTSSLGPEMLEVAFMKMIGSTGTAMFDSAA